MSENKPAIIFCSGAWHREAHIKPILPHFETAGYKVIPHPLVSAGDKTMTAEDAVKSFVSVIEPELKKGRVALILHSAAGPVGLAATHDILAAQPDAKDKLVIMMLGSFLEYGPVTKFLFEKGYADFGRVDGTIECHKAMEAFFNDMAEADAQPYIDALVYQGMAGSPDERSESWKQCQVWCILTEQDKCVPADWQEKMAEEHGLHIARIDAGHDPFISQPAKLVDVIDQALRQ
ncbi:uncharacterized protein MYCFIDRAFT_82309 [Pseudocercospora fijiensis CIRAD86]|uniref:AB hydrolase-1 domain-containing protein n=1 Tax=Pseudocercospora fijiensis (strain CIRAD86) TaxID=383855 RepID=M2ZTQ6_PSEFD|nr:uncharacterized protein MYCFIDRAFT_82309 [Pseudocercospora fijiensis CIRAD86]EME82389.1 hypothetical protein MYCFIDRAFT_82309 [Pseudocercospora fijiensis CIRAD86]